MELEENPFCSTLIPQKQGPETGSLKVKPDVGLILDCGSYRRGYLRSRGLLYLPVSLLQGSGSIFSSYSHSSVYLKYTSK